MQEFRDLTKHLSAPQVARAFLQLSREVQTEIVQLPKERLCRWFNVSNKQQARFMRDAWGSGVEGLISYCKFKSEQKSKAQRERREKDKKHYAAMGKSLKMKQAEKFFM